MSAGGFWKRLLSKTDAGRDNSLLWLNVRCWDWPSCLGRQWPHCDGDSPRTKLVLQGRKIRGRERTRVPARSCGAPGCAVPGPAQL